MVGVINSQKLYSEEGLFSQGIKAGEYTFIAQDARGSNGSLASPADTESQAYQTLEHLRLALKSAGLQPENLVTLTIFLTDYRDALSITKVLDDAFPDANKWYPATTILGVAGLDGGCRVRVDAMATANPNRETIFAAHVPLPTGARCHGIRVGELLFLSGIDSADAPGRPPQAARIESQTLIVLDRIEAVLRSKKRQLGDVFRTFMFMTSAEHRPGYRETRRKRYQGIFREDEFPANSGIYIKDLGKDILVKSVAIAYGGKDITLVSTPKVWLAPGSFSQAFRVETWLFISGQDAIREVKHPVAEVDVLSPEVRRSSAYETEAVDDLAGQTQVALTHIKDIVEEAGGTMDDVVKTTVYLVAGQDRATFSAAYQKFLRCHRKEQAMPSGLSLEVKELAPSCLVEIDAIALLPG